jgi:hypothetical protein
LIVTPLVLKFILILMKASALVYSGFVFYLFGKNGKISKHEMVFVWAFSASGSLFFGIGLFLQNHEIIKGGLFIIGILALIFIHQIITKHHLIKERNNEKINSK